MHDVCTGRSRKIYREQVWMVALSSDVRSAEVWGGLGELGKGGAFTCELRADRAHDKQRSALAYGRVLRITTRAKNDVGVRVAPLLPDQCVPHGFFGVVLRWLKKHPGFCDEVLA